MSITGGEIKERVFDRLQMNSSVAYTDAFFYNVLSKVQNLVNSSLELVVATSTLTTIPAQFFYHLPWHLPDAIRVIDVSDSDVTINHMKRWQELYQFDLSWYTETAASTFLLWSMIGRDMLVLYPAFATASSVDVKYVEYLDALTADASAFGLQDHYLGIVMDITELVLLAHQRELVAGAKKLEEVIKTLQTFKGGTIRW